MTEIAICGGALGGIGAQGFELACTSFFFTFGWLVDGRPGIISLSFIRNSKSSFLSVFHPSSVPLHPTSHIPPLPSSIDSSGS